MFAHLYASARLPLWTRVALFAIDHDGQELRRGQLLYAVDPPGLIRSAEVCRAIRQAVLKGLLKPGSSTLMLWCTGDGTRSASTPGLEEAA